MYIGPEYVSARSFANTSTRGSALHNKLDRIILFFFPRGACGDSPVACSLHQSGMGVIVDKSFHDEGAQVVCMSYDVLQRISFHCPAAGWVGRFSLFYTAGEIFPGFFS